MSKLKAIQHYFRFIQACHQENSLPEFIFAKLCSEMDSRIRGSSAMLLGLFQPHHQSIYNEISAMWIAYLSYYHSVVYHRQGFSRKLFNKIWKPYADAYQALFPGILSDGFYRKQLIAAELFRRKRYEELIKLMLDEGIEKNIYHLKAIPIEDKMVPVVLDKLLISFNTEPGAHDYMYDTKIRFLMTIKIPDNYLVRVINVILPFGIGIDNYRFAEATSSLLATVTVPLECQQRLSPVLIERLMRDRLVYGEKKPLISILRSMQLTDTQLAMLDEKCAAEAKQAEEKAKVEEKNAEEARQNRLRRAFELSTRQIPRNAHEVNQLLDRYLGSFLPDIDDLPIIPDTLIKPAIEQLLHYIENYKVQHNESTKTRMAMRLIRKINTLNDDELNKRVITVFYPCFFKFSHADIEWFSEPIFDKTIITNGSIPVAIEALVKLIATHFNYGVIYEAFEELNAISIPSSMIDWVLRTALPTATRYSLRGGLKLCVAITSKHKLTSEQEKLVFQYIMFMLQVERQNHVIIDAVIALRNIKLPKERLFVFFNTILSERIFLNGIEYFKGGLADQAIQTLAKLLPTNLNTRLPLIMKVINAFGIYSAAKSILQLSASLTVDEQIRLAGILDSHFGTRAIFVTDCLIGRIRTDGNVNIEELIEKHLPVELAERVYRYL